MPTSKFFILRIYGIPRFFALHFISRLYIHLNSFHSLLLFFPHSFLFLSSRHKTSISHQFSMECFSISGAIKGEKGEKKIFRIVRSAERSQVCYFQLHSFNPFSRLNLTRCFYIYHRCPPSRHERC